MADLVLSPALQVIFDRLASPVLQKFADIWDFKDNLQSLHEALLLVQATLEDAEEQQLTNKAVRRWLSKLKNAACDAEDLLDFYTSRETLMSIEHVYGDFPSQIRRGTDAEKIRKMLHVLEKTVKDGLFKFRRPTVVNRQSTIRETSSFVIKSEIYGREDDKENLVKLLLSSQHYQELGYAVCIPIVGIGGIGKTTLAQLAYNDERVIQHFDARMWIFVSDIFNVKKIMKTVIESATKEECKFLEIDLLQSQLWHLLHNKRYLIVLDDVWTEEHEDWDELKPLFRGGVDGCKIILTTRSKKVAFMRDSPISPYYLKGLAEDDCWALFKQRAFRRGEEEKYTNLSLIAKQIVKKCGGVPLAVKSLGSLMRFKREEQQWFFMQNSEFWRLDVCQHRVLPALMLSYLHLPSHLRQCFAFCSIFPRNYEFEKQKLIYLWMAEGLIVQQGSKRPEDIGNEYLIDLLWMSFFQEVEQCHGSRTIRYKMDDIIHDLARYVAEKEYVILEQNLPTNSPAPPQIRHSSVVYKYRDVTIPAALYEADHLRSLLLIGESGSLEKNNKIFSSFEYLRVLDLNNCDVSALPESLGGLICLRYLDLSYTPITKLPESTCNLCSLQTLVLFGCDKLEYLPFVGKMTSLRHLNITGCASLSKMPAGIERLYQLQTLPLFVVSKLYQNPDIGVLKDLNLHGKLNITHLENVRNEEEAHAAGLMRKKNLESLGLYWGGFENVDKSVTKKQYEPVFNLDAREEKLAAGILRGLEPPRNLKKLVINGYPGIRFESWDFPEHLISLDFTNSNNLEHLPALGDLELLQTLSLHGMNRVKRIGREFYGRQRNARSSLEELSLSDFPNLEDWSTGNKENALPQLTKLIVKRCPKLVHIPLSLSLRHLELRDCNLTLVSIANLSLLSVLVIEKIPELVSLPEGLFASARLSSLKILSCPKLVSLPTEIGNLSALKSLTIGWCEELYTLPSLQNMKALESLEISDCHSLISMPDGGIGGLSSLRTLSIENCSSLTSLSCSFEHLTLLEHLTIMYCPSLGSFPEGVQHLSSLRSLTILSCPWFDSLPEGLQNVRTLNCMEISSCPDLTALPEWFEDLDSLRSLTISDCPNLEQLPPGLKHLTKLQHLSIQECPELEERYRQGSGEDWFKISHVPHKYIGSPQVSQSGEASTSGSSSVQTSSH
ncbi:hypothetical protein CerSpe_276180 [Prunus speciosa]